MQKLQFLHKDITPEKSWQFLYKCKSLQIFSAQRLVVFMYREYNGLRVPERIVFKVAVQTYRALHDDAPQYLRQFTAVANIPTRQRLRSSTSDDLCVPAVRLPTVGRRAFSVAGARVWNALPVECRRHFSTFSVHFPKTFQTASLFTLISWPGLLN